MPIYEYQCQHCGHELEVLQKVSDAPLKECPECKQATLNKLVSASAFQLKGSGWYVTDFRDKQKKKETTSPAAETKQASSDTTATETKKEQKATGSEE